MVVSTMRRVVINPGLAALALALAFTGCASAPDYTRPEVKVPTSYREGAPWKEAQPADALPKGRWWSIFGDKELDSLQDRVSVANQDLAAALARIAQARAAARAAGADSLPSFEFNPSAERRQTSDDLSPGGQGQVFTTLRAPVDLSYELDLFGRVRRSVEAADSGYRASLADFENVLLTLQADTARVYFELRSLDSQVELLGQTLELRRRNLDLVRSLFDNGQVSRLDLARAETELASARADISGLKRERGNREHALAVLAGEPASVFSLPPKPLEPGTQPPTVLPGLPSSLLERRPDIAAAERRLMAANARIGAARAAFFPSITLTGSAGFASDELGSIFQWGNRAWALGPFVSLPIFDGGRNQAALDQARGQWEESVARYRQQILVAFAEVEDSLSDLALLAQQSEALREAAVSAHKAAELTDKRYRAGRVSYLEVVVSQRTALAADFLAVRVLGLRLQASVTLVKALGGGWEEL